MNPRNWILAAVALGSGIVFLDGTIVNVALPRIVEELPATFVTTFEGQAYVVSGYLAVLSALLILAGGLADVYGRRRIFAIGLAGFGVTSVLCGLSPTLELLIVFRLAQGATGALLVPGALAIITAAFEGPERGRAFGVWAAATSGMTLIGPVVGGSLVDSIGWRAAFFINVPLVLVALYATLRHVPESRDETRTGGLDWLGSAVIALAVGGLAFGAIRGQERAWQDTVAFIALGMGVVAAIAFPFLMVKRRDPLIPLGLFRSREFTVINLSTFLIYGALYVTFTFQAVFLQGTLGYTALAAGLLGLPTGILLTLLSTRVGSLAGRLGPRPFLVAGPVLMALGLAWQVRIPATSAPWQASPADLRSLLPPADFLVDVLPTLLLFGVGISLVVAPLTTALMDSIPSRNAGIGSAFNNAVSRVGQPLVTAVLFIAITATFYGAVSEAIPRLDFDSAEVRRDVAPLNSPTAELSDEEAMAIRNASADAYRTAMLVNVGLLLAGAAVNALGIRRRKPEAGPEEPATIGRATVGDPSPPPA